MSDAAFDDEESFQVSKAELGEAAEELEYLDLISKGLPRLHAAYQVKWTPAGLTRRLRDRSFANAVAEAEEMRDESVEKCLFDLATGLKVQGEDGESIYQIAPDMRAITLWLYNRRPERWKDAKQVTQTTVAVSIEVKEMAKETILATLSDLSSVGELRALQPGGILDAEIVDDDSDS